MCDAEKREPAAATTLAFNLFILVLHSVFGEKEKCLVMSPVRTRGREGGVGEFFFSCLINKDTVVRIAKNQKMKHSPKETNSPETLKSNFGNFPPVSTLGCFLFFFFVCFAFSLSLSLGWED